MFGNKLSIVKFIHRTVFILMSLSVIYILFSGITRSHHWTLLIAIGAVFIEGIILIFNHWQCPLTSLARKYGGQNGNVTDMFCPAWFVPHVFKTCAVLFFIGIVLLVANCVTT